MLYDDCVGQVFLSDGADDTRFITCQYCRNRNKYDRETCHGCGAPLKGD